MRKLAFATFVALAFLSHAIQAGEPPAAAAEAGIPTMAFTSLEKAIGWKNVLVIDGPTGRTEGISVALDGGEANGPSLLPSISADGRYVSFASEAANLVPGDKNGKADIFVYDRQTHKTERVSVASDGTEANQNSWRNAISADGRYVAFESYATNLVPGGKVPSDIYVHDRQTHQTERVSVSPDGTAGDGYSSHPTISADGRYVAFLSVATNLAPGSSSKKCCYVHDRQTHKTEVFGVECSGYSDPKISADGRFVAYLSGEAANYQAWRIFVHDRQTGLDETVSVGVDNAPPNGSCMCPAISADGRYVAFRSTASNLVPGEASKVPGVFVHDRQTNQNERVSINPDGTQSPAGAFCLISDDGRYVVFQTEAKHFVRDRKAGKTVLVGEGNEFSMAGGGK